MASSPGASCNTDIKCERNDSTEGYSTPTDLDAQDKAPRCSDEGRRGLSSERELGLKDWLRRSDESPDMRGHRIGNLGEALKI